MCEQDELNMTIPAETVRVAQAAFPKGNVYMTMRDELGPIYTDAQFRALFSRLGRPEIAPGMVALVLVMQYAEGLTDRQAADGVRGRLDWKYALGLELTDPGFDHSVLSEFRERLIAGNVEMELLETLLARFQQKGLLQAGGQQRTDATHVLAAVRQLNRLECVAETIRHSLEVLASVVPEWLVQQLTPDWFERYGTRFESYRLPKKKSEREALQLQIGQDGQYLLSCIYSAQAPAWLRNLPAVEIMRQVWIQQYYVENNQLKFRTKPDMPPHQLIIQSPYDPQARNRTKRELNWTGYAVHLTESCNPEQPNFITHVETTPATTHDGAVTQRVHAALADKALLPKEHLLDMAYVDAQHLVISQQDYEVDLVGPVPPDNSWQAKTKQGFDIACFHIDWQAQRVLCPSGHTSQAWQPRQDDNGNDVIEVRFSQTDCRPCLHRTQCTKGKTSPRLLRLRPQAQHQALQAARIRQETDQFKERYKQRAGIEGTISQATRSFNLRRSRFIGLVKTHLQHILTAAAINITRFVAWVSNIPKARTRCTRFAALAPVT